MSPSIFSPSNLLIPLIFLIPFSPSEKAPTCTLDHLSYFLQACKLLSIHSSKLLLVEHGQKMLHDSLMIESKALSLNPPLHTLSTLITCVTQPLMSLGLNGLHDLTSPNRTHIITVAQLKEKFSKVTAKSKIFPITSHSLPA